MDEIQFDEEGIKFRYLSNWKEQNKEMIQNNYNSFQIETKERKKNKNLQFKNLKGKILSKS